MTSWLLTLIAVIFGSLAVAQPVWKTFTGEGLAEVIITTHLEDRYGNLWLGTMDGVYVYNNEKWVEITGIENVEQNSIENIGEVIRMWEDPSTGIYVACEGKLFHFDGKMWVRYRDVDFTEYTARLFLHDSRDDIWLCSEVDETKGNESTITLPIVRGTVTRFNSLNWISYGGYAGGSCYVQRGEEKKFYTAIMEDSRGYIWIGTVQGLNVYSGVQWLHLKSETLPGEYVTGLMCDSKGYVWVATTSGLARFDGTNWEIYKKKHGVVGNTVRQLCEDTVGAIWAVVYGDRAFQGLARFDGNDWFAYSAGKEIPSGALLSDIDELKYQHSILTRSGFARFDGQKWIQPGKGDGIDGSHFYFLETGNTGEFWISSDKGLFRGDGAKFQLIYSPKNGSWDVTAMLLDSQGRVWTFTDDRSIFLTENDTTVGFTEADGLPDEDVNEIIEDRAGRIWLLYRKGAALFQF